MPNYDYRCEKCEHWFEEMRSMSEREVPTTEPCPKCGEMAIVKAIGGMPAINSDTTLTPDKATNGDWSRLMDKMKPKAGSYGRRQLDRTTEISRGRRHYG